MIRQSDSDYYNAYQQFIKLAGEQMEAVIKGTISVDQALGEVQQQVESLLLDINNRGEGKK